MICEHVVFSRTTRALNAGKVQFENKTGQIHAASCSTHILSITRRSNKVDLIERTRGTLSLTRLMDSSRSAAHTYSMHTRSLTMPLWSVGRPSSLLRSRVWSFIYSALRLSRSDKSTTAYYSLCVCMCLGANWSWVRPKQYAGRPTLFDHSHFVLIEFFCSGCRIAESARKCWPEGDRLNWFDCFGLLLR